MDDRQCRCGHEDHYHDGACERCFCEKFVLTDRQLVKCDSNCRAYETPKTFDEAMGTLEHYKNHSYLHGCSHGA